MRHRRQVGRVCLNHHGVARSFLRRGGYVREGLVGEGDHARERDGEAGVQASLHHFSGPCKGMEDARRVAPAAACAPFHDNCRQIIIGLAIVQDDRESQLIRQRELPAEGIQLQVPRSTVPVVVQPGFADGDHPRMPREALQTPLPPVRRCRHIIRVQPCARIHARVSLGQGYGAFCGGQVVPDTQDRSDPCVRGASDDRIQIVHELRRVDVRVGIDQHPELRWILASRPCYHPDEFGRASSGDRLVRRSRRLLLLVCASLCLAACASGAPLRVETRLDRSTISPNGDGSADQATLSYVVSGPARVSVSIAAPNGQRHLLRSGEPRPAGDYHLVFDGSVPRGNDGERRVLLNGIYEVVVEAEGVGRERAASAATLVVQEADVTLPRLNLATLSPTSISPNFDAVDDELIAEYRLSKAATVSFVVEDQLGRKVDRGTLGQRDPGAHREAWTGLVNGRPVPDGVYRYRLMARDAAGNAVEQATSVTVAGGGIPRARILRAEFHPHQLLLGGYVEVSMRVKNVGETTLRSHGPDPGFVYGSYETFGSIANGDFVDRAGRWRAGVDLSEGQPSQGHGLWLPGGSRPASAATPGARYPYRWGFGRDLRPGEEVDVTGEIQLWHRIPTLWLFAGLIQEGIQFHDDGVGRAVVKVTI